MIVVIIMIIGLGIVWTLYASINPFIYKLGSVVNYNIAYYGAVMSVERWLLALKYHDAWFEWESWLAAWNTSDNLRINTSSFGRYTTSPDKTDAKRTITSRVSSIPSNFSTYNTLTYREWLELPLYIDTKTGASDYYTPIDVVNDIERIGSASDPLYLQGTFKLPPQIKAAFDAGWWAWWHLDEGSDIDTDQINDDIILNWGIRGKENDGTIWPDFIIFPSISRNPNNTVYYDYDNALRESTINYWDNNIEMNNFMISNPALNQGVSLTQNNIIPLDSMYILSWLANIVSDAYYPIISFAITNLMKTPNNNIYPYIAWQLRACSDSNCVTPVQMSDRYFTLNAMWTSFTYTVNLLIKKPIRKNTNTSNFTIIF